MIEMIVMLFICLLILGLWVAYTSFENSNIELRVILLETKLAILENYLDNVEKKE